MAEELARWAHLPDGWGSAVAISDDGRSCAAASQGRVFLWDAARTRPRSLLLPGESGQALRFRPDGETLLCGAYRVAVATSDVLAPSNSPVTALAQALGVRDTVVTVDTAARSGDGRALLVIGQIVPPRDPATPPPDDVFSRWCGVLDADGAWLLPPERVAARLGRMMVVSLPTGVAMAVGRIVLRFERQGDGIAKTTLTLDAVRSLCASCTDVVALLEGGELVHIDDRGRVTPGGREPLPAARLVRADGPRLWVAAPRRIATLDGATALEVADEVRDFAVTKAGGRIVAALEPRGEIFERTLP